MIGFILVAISSICFPDPSGGSSEKKFDFKSVIGILALFLSLIFQGFCYCYQENVLDKYELNVMQMIGFESMVGAVTSTAIMFVVMNITCTYPEFCNAEMGFPIDSPPTALYDLKFKQRSLFFILTCLSIMIFNLCGLTITKNAGAVFKMVLDTLRTITVWIISIIIRFEKINPFEKVAIELVGFIFLISGNLIFNELIVIKICGLHKYTKKYRKITENKNEEPLIEE